MKAKTERLRYRQQITILFIIALLINNLSSYGQNEVKSVKSVEKVEKILKIETNQNQTKGDERFIETKINIDFRPDVKIKVFDTKTEIFPARGNEIVVKIMFTAITENKDDIETLENAMMSNLITKTGKEVSIKLDFYKTMNTTISPTKWKTTIKLKNNKKIRLSEFQVKEIKIYVPADADMVLDAKYSKVYLNFSINGNLEIMGYDLVMNAKNVSNKLNIDAKYSKLEFLSAGNTQLNLYESKFRAKQLKKVKADSKYSHLNIGTVDEMNLTGYEDHINIKNIPRLQIVGNYCEIEVENNKYLNAKLYEGSLKSRNSDYVVLASKYLEAKFGKLNKLAMTDGYENNLEIAEIDTLISSNGKYNEFNIGKINTLLNIDGYEDDIKLDLVSDKFEKIWISGKYMDIKMNISDKVPYKLYGNIQYPNLNIKRDDYKVVFHDKEGSNLKFEYYKHDDNAKKEIKLNGYELDLRLNHQ